MGFVSILCLRFSGFQLENWAIQITIKEHPDQGPWNVHQPSLQILFKGFYQNFINCKYLCSRGRHFWHNCSKHFFCKILDKFVGRNNLITFTPRFGRWREGLTTFLEPQRGLLEKIPLHLVQCGRANVKPICDFKDYLVLYVYIYIYTELCFNWL